MDDDLTTPLLSSSKTTTQTPTTLRFRRSINENRAIFVFFIIEAVGTFFSVLFAIGSVLSVGTLTYQFKYSEMSPGRLLAVSLAYGFGYASVLYTCRKLSVPYLRSKVAAQRRGSSHYLLKFPVGHCNPAVTFAVCLVGDISAMLSLFHILGQFVGAMGAAKFVQYVFPNSADTTLGATIPGLGASEYQVFGVELVTSLILILALLHFFVQNNEKVLKDRVAADEKVGPILVEETGPFAIGLIMSALCMVSSQMSGGSMNPFRSISSAYVSDIWTSQWVYCAAPMTAAVLAASISKAVGTFRS